MLPVRQGPVRVVLPLVVAALVAACAGSAPESSSPLTSSSPPASSSTPLRSPETGTAGPYPALIVTLGLGAAPIDVVTAFGSVWVANHRDHSVVRIDPATGLEEARIHLNFSGPGWFAVTDDAIWVTRQTDVGMARMDPATNEADPTQVGFGPPCWRPAVGLGAVWYYSCDRGELVRIDLATMEAAEIPAAGLSAPVIVDDVLYSAGPDGVVRLADDGTTWEAVGGCCGTPIGYAGGTLWLANAQTIVRVDLATGTVVATIPLASVTSMGAGAEVAWLPPGELAPGPLQQVRLSDNAILDELPVGGSAASVFAEGSTLWVTDFYADELWRIDLGG